MTNPVTLDEARAWLRARIDDGALCPCCTQMVKAYRRQINSRQARCLIAIYRAAGTDWCHIPTVEAKLGLGGSETGRLRHWGLITELQARRDDGGRAGWWRITDRGERYVQGKLRVPRYARIFNARCLELYGEPVGILDALGTEFNYTELMGTTTNHQGATA